MMKLGKLLAAGKGIFAPREEIAYRVSKHPLPKFGSEKNPFSPAPRPELPKMDGVKAAEVEREAAQPLLPAKTQKMPTLPEAPKAGPGWASKLNPMSLLRDTRTEKKEVQAVQAVQAELSLDKVKVVHNDLTDADVEVVPIKSRPQAEVPELQPAKKSWEILGERLMRATAL
ncbi:MAG TPA: hypothetical protein VFV81_01465 [Verrucomicrobiae bacterium]|nr:hypothetical protein [Verrucomicrobiae bacterium]